ncbi:uncharacterized protein UTRI_10254 [Ustilago trichophora]|uniref:Uncharacterized protein n=1 Tax=Ustilago trichophora TaxID=86804 RepID=A0A5C3EK64_9BASI|nr:uncharacterized protein UTRI_10254 [Ustilago trichophora]
MSNPMPTKWGHRPRLCRCKECCESGQHFTYEQWRWHKMKKQHRHIAQEVALSRSEPQITLVVPSSLLSSLPLLPIASFLSKAGCLRQEPCADESRHTRQRIDNTSTSSGMPLANDGLPALCLADDSNQEAEDSKSNNSNAVLAFPDLPAKDVSNNSFDNGSAIDAATEDDTPISSQDRLTLAQAHLLDSSLSHIDIDHQSVEEAVTDHAQHQRNRFVMVNYIFVMYLMTFHRLSNTITTLYLSFALHMLSQFCAFVADTNALTGTPPPQLSPCHAPSQPLPPPPGLVHRAPDSLLSQLLPLPLSPLPLPMLITPASVRQRLGMHSDFDEYLVCAHCGELMLWNGIDAPRTRLI